MKLKNSITGKLEEINLSSKFDMYVCGPTVYDHIHIGNLRPVITYDLLNRLLRYLNVNVNFIHNITDIDDKIINKSIEKNISEKDISEKYYKSYINNLNQTNILIPDNLPNITDNMEIIINVIEKLIKNNSAYEKEGNVFFKVDTLKEYGEISKVDLSKNFNKEDELEKKNKNDFALWKKTTKGITFKSPWSNGRPGWHTECVALIDKFVGKTLNLHAGGSDLKFPHHENENAQWRAIYSTPLSNHWSHVGHINFNNEKMSKSIGNIIKANDFINKYSGNHLRMLMYMSDYSSPMNINDKLLEFVEKEILKIKSLILKINLSEFKLEKSEPILDVIESLKNDLNTPNALTIISVKTKKINSLLKDGKTFNEDVSELYETYKLMGFNFNFIIDKKIINSYKELIKNKKYKESDLIRNEIMQKL